MRYIPAKTLFRGTKWTAQRWFDNGGIGVCVCWTHRRKLTVLAFPSLLLGGVSGFPLSPPELKSTPSLALDPIRVIREVKFMEQRMVFLQFISATAKK